MNEFPTNEPATRSPHDERGTPPTQESDGIGVLDILVTFAKHKWVLISVPVVAAVAAVIYSLLLPNIYTASTKILPPQQNQSSAAAMLAQLGNAAALVGGAAGVKNPNDLYIGMLKSRTVADNIIQRFDLIKVYDLKLASYARARLARDTSITTGKDSIIAIDVDSTDPKFAAELANAYVDELMKLTQSLAVTEASQRRLFFERQLIQAKNNLGKSESAARQALQHGGLIKVDDQGRAMVETTARLRAQMSVKEVQIGAMRTFAGEQNPELRLAQQELEAMRRELGKIEGAGGGRSSSVGSEGKGIDNLNLLRELKYHETLYELLAKQFEIAKIDEAKEGAVVQVLDKAIEPDVKSKPKRSLIVQLSFFAALLLAIMWVFIREAMLKARSDPRRAEHLRALKLHLLRR